jgi:YhcH/YjgK/YiaL family protein
MIVDNIKNANRYFGISERLTESLKHIIANGFANRDLGKYEISGNTIFGIKSEYDTSINYDPKLEAHKKYIDLHYIIEGEEIINYELLKNQNVIKEYDIDGDYMFYQSTKSTLINLKKGDFAIFYPNDLHLPGITVNENTKAKKVVIKILID